MVLQTEDASDKLRDIIAPMAGSLSSALTPLKGMVRQPYFFPGVSTTMQNTAIYCAVASQFIVTDPQAWYISTAHEMQNISRQQQL